MGDCSGFFACVIVAGVLSVVIVAWVEAFQKVVEDRKNEPE